MYLIRTTYDSQTAKTAKTFKDAAKIAKKLDGATIFDCDDYYYSDNFDGWMPKNCRGEYLPTGECIG